MEPSPITDDFVFPWFLGNDGIEAYRRATSYLTLDFETSNIQKGTATNPDNTIVLACWTLVKDGVRTKKYKFGNEYEMQELVDDVASVDFIVAYNSQFEGSWLARCGLDLHDVLVYDPMVVEWVIAGNRKQPFTLQHVAKSYGFSGKGDVVSMLIKLGVCPSTIPRSWLLKYCALDVDLTEQVFLKQKEVIENLDLWHIVLSRNLVIPVLADIQANGLELDKEMVYEEEARLQEVVDRLGEELDEITGGINLGSPKQLGKFLYEDMAFTKVRDPKSGEPLTGTGQPVIAQLKCSTKKQEHFLELFKEYNTASSLLSKNVNFFRRVCEDLGGRYNSAIAQCRAGTHRLAGSGIAYLFKGMKKEMRVQAQNLPRQYKKMFTAHDDNYVVLETDGAGMEARVAAIIAHDTVMRDDILGGADIHSVTRDTMNAAYERLGVKKVIDRQTAKSSTFSPLYGGNGKDEAEREYVKFFREKYKAISDMQSSWTMAVADKKQLTTQWGMIFYWPDAKMHRSGYVSRTTEIYNYPVQNLATGEIIPVALTYFWHRIKGKPIYLWNTVHDSLVSRVHVDHVEEAKQLSKIAMTTDVYKFFSDVYRYELWDELPLGAGMKVGKSWGVSDTEEVYEVWKNGRERLTTEVGKNKVVTYDTEEEGAEP